MKLFSIPTLPVVLALYGLSAQTYGALALPMTVYAHDTRDNFDGNYLDMGNGSGMNGVNWPDDQVSWPPTTHPSTWTATGNTYRDEWQSLSLLTGATNGKIGWAAFDLGSVVDDLDEIYIWHIRENNGRWAKEYNIYYASTPTVSLPSQTPAALKGDYDFASGGWTLLNTDVVLVGSGFRSSDVYDLGGISARYIGIEILSNNGDTQRVGFAEVAITVIPEPTAALLGGLGFLLLLRRRR